MSEDSPLEALNTEGMYRANVIDLDGVRIKAGHTPYKTKACDHLQLIFSLGERRVWCESCERTIDNFDAFMTFVNHLDRMVLAARHDLDTAERALAATVRMRATKELDRMWAGKRMVPCCPHCHGGLLPDDFAGGACSATSYELEVARRKVKDAP